MINIEKYFSNFFKGTKNPSLHAMKFFMDKYNNFEKHMKFIHIAGTNGKGSCTEILTNILVHNNYKVGKFLSPHLIKYNERISINNINISDKDLEDLINELTPLIKEYNAIHNIDITLFELETIIGLLYFYRNNVDFVILETGLGGLYDCTNIISKPLVSIITSIAIDHSHILGTTLPEIAYQKAGIIKDNSNTVIFNQSTEIDDVFAKTCAIKNNSIHIVKNSDISNYRLENTLQSFDYKSFKELKLNLKGKMQIRNCCLCLETINILKKIGYDINTEKLKNALTTIIHRGRMEELSTSPKIIFDGAHNPHAISCLLENINLYYNNSNRVYIISILKQKDYDKMLQLLSIDKNATFILTSGSNTDKYASSQELYNCAITYIKKENLLLMSLDNAIETAIQNELCSTYFFIGSFYIYGTVVNKIKSCLNA